MIDKQQITGIYPEKCKYCKTVRYKHNFLKKYWCNLNNKLCGYVGVNECKYEVKDNDK